ncbi:MAG: ImcF-related family protein, partial [Bdellovibrionota bacterium]
PFQLDIFPNKTSIRNTNAYFVKKLFTEVIIPDKEIAAPNLYIKKKIFVIRKFAYLGSIALTILATILWSVSYFSNKSYVLSLDSELSKYSPEHFSQLLNTNNNLDPNAQSTTIQLLQGLHELSGIPEGYDDKRANASIGFPITGLGLYQGDKLNKAAEDIYLKSLQRHFIPYLKNILEIQLS